MGSSSSFLKRDDILDSDKLDEIWDRFDADHSSTLDQQEFASLMTSLSKSLHNQPNAPSSSTLLPSNLVQPITREQFNFVLVDFFSTQAIQVHPTLAESYISPSAAIRAHNTAALSRYLAAGLPVPTQAFELALEPTNLQMLELILRAAKTYSPPSASPFILKKKIFL